MQAWSQNLFLTSKGPKKNLGGRDERIIVNLRNRGGAKEGRGPPDGRLNSLPGGPPPPQKFKSLFYI